MGSEGPLVPKARTATDGRRTEAVLRASESKRFIAEKDEEKREGKKFQKNETRSNTFYCCEETVQTAQRFIPPSYKQDSCEYIRHILWPWWARTKTTGQGRRAANFSCPKREMRNVNAINQDCRRPSRSPIVAV